MRRLIINADDLGLTKGVNRGILDGHAGGLITSTTLMANSQAFQDAVALVSELPQLSVGCHVVLLDGSPLSPPDQVKTLVRRGPRKAPPLAVQNCHHARFRDSLLDFAAATVLGRIRAEEIEREATMQFQKIQNAGIKLSHYDTHKHAHLFPGVLKPLLRAARACGIRALRNPFAPVKPLAFAHLMRRPVLWKRYSEVKVLRGMEERFRELVDQAGMVTTDGSFGVVSTGALDAKLFRCIVAAIPEGTWEFVCHPGYNDAELASVRTRLRASRERELQVLTSPESREVLKEYGVELISFRDLLQQSAQISGSTT